MTAATFETPTGDKKIVEIPVWFLKLSGWMVGLLAAGVIYWMSWVSISLIEIRSSTELAVKNATDIERIRNDVLHLKIQTDRLQSERNQERRKEP